MPSFTKAKPEQARLKVSLYGPPGSGKTFTALLLAEGLAAIDGKRIAYVDTERGTDFYAVNAARSVHPDAFDFDALYTSSLADVREAVHSLDPTTHGVIVLDSISHLWDAAIAAYDGKKVGKAEDKIPMHAWGSIKKPYKDMLRWLMDSPFHFILCGRQKNVFETDENDEIRKTGVAMRAEGETAYEPHICIRMETRVANANEGIQTVYAVVEKDRTGVIAGRTIPNPSFKTFEPILGLMGTTQAKSEDPDEVASRDSELLREQEEKNAAKASRSSELFAKLRGDLETAKDLATLEEWAAAMKRQRRYLTDDHLNTLRTIYKHKRDHILETLAPENV